MKILAVIVVLISLLIGYGYHKFVSLTRPLPLPTFELNKYWGPGNVSSYIEDAAIYEFKVNRTKEEIDDLKQQLTRLSKLTEPLEDVPKFSYGYNTNALKQFVNFWKDAYLKHWRQREDILNGFPQFTTQIQGLRIHYIHAKPTAEDSEGKKVIPMLLLHGWPGSVREFYDFIPLLTKTESHSPYVYEVIAPSLVGFGWSDHARKPGFNAAEMAIVMRNLMLRVGHEKFLIQGGDWGSIIGSVLSTLFPDNVIGYHSNFCVLHTPLAILKGIIAEYNPEKYLPSARFYDHHFPLKEKLEFSIKESGYFHIQATKPDTLGAALSNNPIGLAAYILEKFQTATGPGRNEKFSSLAKVYRLEALMDNLMIYYLSNTATSSARFYAENMSKSYLSLQLDRVQTSVPMGCARFINDLTPALDWQLQDKFPNMIHSKYFNEGGHFAALEMPAMLYFDFQEFVEKLNLK